MLRKRLRAKPEEVLSAHNTRSRGCIIYFKEFAIIATVTIGLYCDHLLCYCVVNYY